MMKTRIENAEELRPVRRRRRALLGSVITALLVLALAAPNVGAGVTRDPISGTASFSDCNGNEGVGALEFAGDLDGCLIFTPRFSECTELLGFALYEERGAETFRGSYLGSTGVFRTTYTLTATYEQGSCEAFDAGNPPYEAQITGGCDHSIRGTRGVFRDLTGNFNIFDVIPEPGVSGAAEFHWAGYIG